MSTALHARCAVLENSTAFWARRFTLKNWAPRQCRVDISHQMIIFCSTKPGFGSYCLGA